MAKYPVVVDLEHVEKSNTILLGYEIGSAETEKGKLHVVASGKTVRFRLDGVEGHVDVDLKEVAQEAYDLLIGESNLDSLP